MMGFKASFVFFFFAFHLVSSYSIESPDELYWKSKLGNITMPTVLKASLQLGSNDKIVNGHPQFQLGDKIGVLDETPYFWYMYIDNSSVSHGNPRPQANPHQHGVKFLTLENLSKAGTKIKIFFRKVNDGRKFLPLQITQLISIASNQLETTLDILSVNPKSFEAKFIAKMINDCKRKDLRDEVIHCVASLKDMVDFVTSSSNSMKAKFIAVASQEENEAFMDYTIQKSQKIETNDNHTIVCHRMNNPFVVFLCHNIKSTDSYNVSLVGFNGKQTNAIAVCHKDTSKWHPRHIAFQQLKVKPGSKPICHFLSGDTLVWLPNKDF